MLDTFRQYLLQFLIPGPYACPIRAAAPEHHIAARTLDPSQERATVVPRDLPISNHLPFTPTET